MPAQPAVEILPPATITAPAITWMVPVVDGDMETVAWEQAKSAWLKTKYRKSSSAHTVAAYERDWFEFFTWFNNHPKNVTGQDAEMWLQHLEEKGLKPSTINRKLAALSSFYTYVIEKYILRDKWGIERTIFLDPTGNPRQNPFKRPDRFRLEQYNLSRPVAARTVQAALRKINQATPTGARDYALIMTYLLTGRRSVEVGSLKWENINPDTSVSTVYYNYRGKGDKKRTKVLPDPAYHAIIAFLKITDRLRTIQPGDYIFQPIYPGNAARLPNVDPAKIDANRPISGSLINRIIKKRFVAVGVAPEDIHTHTLRHTAASLRYRDGDGEDFAAVSEFLDHSSYDMTRRYLTTNRKPVDTGWLAVQQQIMI